MTKISNQVVYIPDTEINGLDYFIGTDYGNAKKTVNFRVEDLGSHFNMVNGVRNFDYIFYEHQGVNPTPTDGYFYSNGNTQVPEDITHFIFPKKTYRGKDSSQFFLSIATENPFDLIIAQKIDNNTVFFFRIDSIETFTNYFKLNVSEVFFHDGKALDYVLSYAVFNLKSEGGPAVTKTSDLINDGEDGTNPFITLQDLPSDPTKTSNLANDGSDGTSTYVETDELGAIAFSNDYNDLDNKPVTFPPSNHTHVEADILDLDKYTKAQTDSGFIATVPNFIYVRSANDFPNAVSGVRTLLPDTTYFIADTIDLNGDRLVGSSNTTILGASSENSILTSTGLGVGIPLLSSIYTTPIRHIAINNVDTAVNFDGTSNPSDMALDWTGVNFVNVPNVGTIKKASNFIFDKGAFLNSKGLVFDGTIGTVALNNSLFSGDGLAGNILQLLSTCTITRRFRVIYSSIVATSSNVGINVNASASIPVESYILDTVNFSGGATYLSGVSVTDNKTLFANCKGIANTNEVSQYYMNGNATTTTVSATNTPYKVLGTTTSASITQKFTNTNNRATYVGSLTRFFKATATLSLESGNNNQVGCYIAKNGTILNESEVYGTTSGAGRAENIVIQTLVELSTNDYIEIFIENATAVNNILVTDLNTIIQ